MNLILLLFLCIQGFANRIETYNGAAKKDGKVVYTEKHTVTYTDDGSLLRAKTEYFDLEQKPIATMDSDFTQSLTYPNYEMLNHRSGNRQGLKRESGKVILFDQDKGKKEKTKVLEEKSAQERILMGCQGFNYYLVGNLDNVEAGKSIPIRLLIPGKLDYYDFRVKYMGLDSSGNADFELYVDNWFLKMIAPKLFVKYDKKFKRIIWYKGLSNIPDENGDTQSVEIDYNYDSAKN